MTNVLVVLLFVVFSTHFIAEVFVKGDKLQNLLNNLAGIGLTLWFLIAIVGTFIFGA